jgi:hypothetical protein
MTLAAPFHIERGRALGPPSWNCAFRSGYFTGGLITPFMICSPIEFIFEM